MLIYYGDIAESFSGTPDERCNIYRKAETILFQQVRTNAEIYNHCLCARYIIAWWFNDDKNWLSF